MNEMKNTVTIEEQIDEVRRKFLSDYEKDKDLYDIEDVNRVKRSRWQVERYLIWKNGDVQAAVEALIVTMRWRKSFPTHPISTSTDTTFPQEFWKTGGVSIYSKNNKGQPILLMRIKVHRRVPKLIKHI